MRVTSIALMLAVDLKIEQAIAYTILDPQRLLMPAGRNERLTSDRDHQTVLNGCPAILSKRPNIILIMADNQPADMLGCYGNSEIHTPYLDTLAAQGMRFENAFCVNAMCSRAGHRF